MTAQRVAHRGAGGRENTIAAFSRAVSLGCDWLELDVRTTADGVPIALHDETLERMWNVPHRVDQLTWAQISQVGSDEYVIPRLRDALEWAAAAPISVMIDVPTEMDAMGALTLVRQMRIGIPIGWCGDLAATKAIRAADRAAVVQYNHPGGDLDLVSLISLDAQAVNANWQVYSDVLIEQIHALGLRAWAWTANEAHEMEYLLELGVDAITTDNLPTLNRVLDSHRGPPPLYHY